MSRDYGIFETQRHPSPDKTRAESIVVDSLSKRCYLVSSNERKEVNLTRLEYRLLVTFVSNKGICLSRDSLLAQVWGIDFETGTNNVDVAVCSLRKKLRAATSRQFVTTVRQFGYRYD